MSWWKPLVLVLTMPLVLVVLQVLAYQLVGVIEGSDDPLSPELTPLKSLAVNLATGATGLVAVLLLVWMTRVPWRALFSSRRAFDRRRLAHYTIGAAYERRRRRHASDRGRTHEPGLSMPQRHGVDWGT